MTSDDPSDSAPVPAPSRTDRVDAVETRVERLPDLSDRIRKAGAAPLKERAAILAAIHETLSSELRDAED